LNEFYWILDETGEQWEWELEHWYVNDQVIYNKLGAWVVADVVPIPGAVWLLGSGLVGLVGLRKKLKK
jgi:hypothetical protein